MIGVIYVSGENYYPLIDRAVLSFKRATGLDCIVVIGHCASFREACLEKIRFLAEHLHERFISFDVDTRFLQPLPLGHFKNPERVYGVMDAGKDWGPIREDRKFYGIEDLPYINGGFYVADPAHHRRIFERVLELAERHPNVRFNEQTHLNAALCEAGVTRVVECRFNANARNIDGDTIMAHAFRERGPVAKGKLLDEVEERFSLLV